MNKKVIAFVKAALRRTWGRSMQKRDAMRAAKVEYGKYRCAKCGGIFRRKLIQIDHIVPVGKFLSFDLYIERLFCPKTGLQLLCVECHKIKTKSDRKKMK